MKILLTPNVWTVYRQSYVIMGSVDEDHSSISAYIYTICGCTDVVGVNVHWWSECLVFSVLERHTQERLEALMRRSLERSLQLENRTKRWAWGPNGTAQGECNEEKQRLGGGEWAVMSENGSKALLWGNVSWYGGFQQSTQGQLMKMLPCGIFLTKFNFICSAFCLLFYLYLFFKVSRTFIFNFRQCGAC